MSDTAAIIIILIIASMLVGMMGFIIGLVTAGEPKEYTTCKISETNSSQIECRTHRVENIITYHDR